MRSGWRIGSLFGIPLLLDSSWFLIVAWVTYSYGSLWQEEDWGGSVAWVAGFAMALSLFGSVLLHEIGHSLVALSQGIKVNSITLFLFGGVASIDEESKTPRQAFQVAIAGPSVSFGLFVLLALLYRLPLAAPVAAVVKDLEEINLVLALFNMLPGLPLDGGHVLKATIWKLTGSKLKGVRWAARTGQYLGWGAIFFSLTLFVTTLNPFILWLALLGWFGVSNAVSYSRVVDLQEALLKLKAVDAMTNDYRVVDANLTLREFMDKYLLLEDTQLPAFYGTSEGRYRGWLSLDDLRASPRSTWETATLQTLLQPLSKIPSVPESALLIDVVEELEQQELRRITVLSPAGAVVGTVDRGDIVRAIATQLKVPIADTLIKRIKDDGTYPPGLQLRAIARSARD